MSSNSIDNKSSCKRKNSFSMTKPAVLKTNSLTSDFYDIVKELKTPKQIYSTPAETIKYLLDTYCFNDLAPFVSPVNLLLNSSALA